MWFCDISKCLIGEETRRTRIDGFIISQFFSRTIPSYAHILLAATRRAACHEELCMTHR